MAIYYWALTFLPFLFLPFLYNIEKFFAEKLAYIRKKQYLCTELRVNPDGQPTVNYNV